MSFENPWLLLGLPLLAAAVGVWLLAERRRARYTVRYPNLEVLASVVPPRSASRLIAPVLLLLALASLLVGVARPHVARMVLSDRATVILVLDTSRSMQAEDVPPTRLRAAQEALHAFLDRAPEGLRVGFVVFAGESQIATPPTRDHELVGTAIDEADGFLVFGGTAIGDALKVAVELGRKVVDLPPGQEIAFRPSREITRSLAQSSGSVRKSPVSILFLSDGAQTRGLLQPLEGAALARDAGIPVYTVALGTPGGVIERGQFGFPSQGGSQLIPVPPDPVTLQEIAKRTGGEFTEARTADALGKAYQNLGSRLGREPGEAEVTFLLVAFAALLAVVAGAVSVVTAPRLP